VGLYTNAGGGRSVGYLDPRQKTKEANPEDLHYVTGGGFSVLNSYGIRAGEKII